MDKVFLSSPPLQEPIPIIRDEELLDSQPKFPSPPSTLLDVLPPSVEHDLDDLNFYAYVPREKRKHSKERLKKNDKKPNAENKRRSGIVVGYWEKLPEIKVVEKKRRKPLVKRETIDNVASVESMKEVDRKLWLTHYDMLSKKLTEVIKEKCTGCEMNEPNQLAHEFCLLASVEEQVNVCFREVYKRVIWDEVLDNWNKKVLEMPVNLNPETLIIFRESVNPKEHVYRDRMRKWLIESLTIEL